MGGGGGLLAGSLNFHSCFPPHSVQLSAAPALPRGIYPSIAPLCSKHSQQGQQGDVVGFAAEGDASVLVPAPTADQEVFSKQDTVPRAMPVAVTLQQCGCTLA